MTRFIAAAALFVISAPALACTGNVVIGEVATTVPNKSIGASCINDLIIDTVAEGANYESPGNFFGTVSDLTGKWLDAGLITRAEREAIRAAAKASNVGKTVTLRVIGLNDFHGNLQSPGTFGENLNVPPAQRPTVGGAEFIAGHVAKLKLENPLSTVVGAGDFIGASPLISALFNDEPSVEVMNRIGLEFNSVGNHEFDKGSSELLRLQNGGCKADGTGCRGAAVGTPVPFEGARFRWLSANVISTATGRPLLPPYAIKSFGRWKIAFIGMTLKETPTIVTPSGVAGLEFRDEADTVNALIPELRDAGAHAIVVLVHQGGFQTGSLSDINRCDGELAGSAIASIVSRLSDRVDAVVSGHTQAHYNCLLPNASGSAIPVTSASAFGRILTALDLTIDTHEKRVVAAQARNHLTAQNDPAVAPNAPVKAIVDGYNALVSPIANVVIGSITAALPNSADAACNNPAGD